MAAHADIEGLGTKCRTVHGIARHSSSHSRIQGTQIISITSGMRQGKLCTSCRGRNELETRYRRTGVLDTQPMDGGDKTEHYAAPNTDLQGAYDDVIHPAIAGCTPTAKRSIPTIIESWRMKATAKENKSLAVFASWREFLIHKSGPFRLQPQIT